MERKNTERAYERNAFIKEISEKTGKFPKERKSDRATRFYRELVSSQRTADFMMNNPELVYTQIVGKKAAVLAGFPEGRPEPPTKEYVNGRIAALENLERRIPADLFMKDCGFYLTYAFAKHPELFEDVPTEVWRRAASSPFVLRTWRNRRMKAAESTAGKGRPATLSAGA